MASRKNDDRLRSIAVIGNHLPRHCGIATFTSDLCDGLETQLKGEGGVLVTAMNDLPEGYPYPPRVRFELQANVQADYGMAADFLNINQMDAVILQHEFGIFGGPAGGHILRLLRELRMPVITSLHTVLTEPEPDYLAVMKELIEVSDRLVVLSERAVEMLTSSYDVPEHKVVYIPHGIHDVPFVDTSFHKDLFGVEGRDVILTFGLLSPGKGIEEMLQAMPAVAERHPDAVYMLLGATHPHVVRHSGEEYRLGLQRLCEDLGIADRVQFHNRFVALEELVQYIGAADVYVTPYHNEAQIVSGTLAYALGAGKAVVSTPYWHAQEMLAEGRGRLVPFRSPEALAENVIDLLDNDVERDAMRKRAYQFCRDMVWGKVARTYLDVAHQVHAEQVKSPRPIWGSLDRAQPLEELPEPDLRHLQVMTDDTGLLRHALFATPQRRDGYWTEDNARALAASALCWKLREDKTVLPLANVYLSLIDDALDRETGRFREWMSYDRQWSAEASSEDCHAWVLWGLGMAVSNAPTDSILSTAMRLFSEALPPVANFRLARACGLALVGIHTYLAQFRGDAEARRVRDAIAERLLGYFEDHAGDEWPWHQDMVRHSNGWIPHGLLLSGQWVPNDRMSFHAFRTLDWLLRIQTEEAGQLSLIGDSGWFLRSGERAHFNQQPLEVVGLIAACAEAFRCTREKRWIDEARRCLGWFLGRNDLQARLYDFRTGGCRDGLQPHGPNQNQGATATLAWLLSLTMVHQMSIEQTLYAESKEPPQEPEASDE